MLEELTKNSIKLGFGLMRLPTLPDGKIDVEQTAAMVDAFLAGGGTYFDTAYVYTGSEEAARRALVERHPRGSYTLATKQNVHAARNAEEARQQLFTSLERLGTDYVDYYLLHAIMPQNAPLYEQYGIWEFVKEQKEAGRIRHIGFSFHGGPELLDKLLTEHTEVEFVQLQLNYADWESQEVRGRENYEVVRKHGKHIIVMEPVKGGALANPPAGIREMFDKAAPGASYPSWAVRYIASREGVAVVLSGMSTLGQVEDNLSTMHPFVPLSEDEEALIVRAQKILEDSVAIPCTACRYCVEGCPMNIPIPRIFKIRNSQLTYGDTERAKEDYADWTEGRGKASDCIHCLQCEDACPQHLHITDLLAECAAALE